MRLAKRSYSISAGDLKDRCTLMVPTSVRNGRGGFDTTFAEYGGSGHGGVWCQAKPANNSRVLAEAQLTFYDAFVFVIRVSEVPIKATWQITFNSRTYTIHSIQDVENRYQYLNILAYSAKLA